MSLISHLLFYHHPYSYMYHHSKSVSLLTEWRQLNWQDGVKSNEITCNYYCCHFSYFIISGIQIENWDKLVLCYDSFMYEGVTLSRNLHLPVPLYETYMSASELNLPWFVYLSEGIGLLRILQEMDWTCPSQMLHLLIWMWQNCRILGGMENTIWRTR